jgi:cyclic beta-1,2-glucan synthetase
MMGDGDKAHEVFSMLNPINHADTRTGMHRYRVEPYVAVADVYSEPPHVGRGGWSWYTGSSGWLYRAGVEWILGLSVRGDSLHLDPCIPRTWPGFVVTYRHGGSCYEISVENPNRVTRGIAQLLLDGEHLPAVEGMVPLKDDGREHAVKVLLGDQRSVHAH